MKPAVPIYLLSGFLGSGKTTLLNGLLDYCAEAGMKPAVVMNEIGDINIDGQIVGADIPMAEMLSGCICCTISGDLSATILALCREHRPDLIIVEATGVANPLDVIDGITESSLLTEAALQWIVTVVDVPNLLALSREGKGRTLRLMEEQIRCAGWLVLNKADLVDAAELQEAERIVRELNPHAPIRITVRCQGGLDFIDATPVLIGGMRGGRGHDNSRRESDSHGHDDHDHDHDHDHHHHDKHEAGHRHSHEHAMVYTHYLHGAIDRERFEQLFHSLPQQLYRAKGIVRFAGDEQLSLFQFAYKRLETWHIRPQAEVPQVAVFIGEHFAKDEVAAAIDNLIDKLMD